MLLRQRCLTMTDRETGRQHIVIVQHVHLRYSFIVLCATDCLYAWIHCRRRRKLGLVAGTAGRTDCWLRHWNPFCKDLLPARIVWSSHKGLRCQADRCTFMGIRPDNHPKKDRAPLIMMEITHQSELCGNQFWFWRKKIHILYAAMNRNEGPSMPPWTKSNFLT